MSRFQVGDKVTIRPGTPGIGDREYEKPYQVTRSYNNSVLLADSLEEDYGGQFLDYELLPYEMVPPEAHVVFKPEADALAMIEAVRKWRHDWFNEPVEGVHRKRHLRRLDAILDGPEPSD